MPARGTGPETFDEIDVSGGGVGRVAHPTKRCSGPATPSPGTATSGRSTLSTPRDWTTGWPKLGQSGGVRPLQLPPPGRGRHRGLSRRVGPAVGGMTAPTDEESGIGRALRGATRRHRLLSAARARHAAPAAPFDSETLVVAGSVGVADYFLAPGERLGVSSARRPVLPTVLFGKTRIITYEEDLFLFISRKAVWKIRAPS